MKLEDVEKVYAQSKSKFSCWHCLDTGRTFFIVGKDVRSERPCEHCGRNQMNALAINELASKLADQ